MGLRVWGMEENANGDAGKEPNPQPDWSWLPGPDWEEAWREMGMEEQDEYMDQMLAKLKEHREEIAEKFPEADVEGAIARLSATAEERHRLTARVRETEEEWLQALANEADAEANLTVMMAAIMKDVENFTEEKWAELPVGLRTEMMNQLQEWQRDKEEILSQLPIEERRKLE